MSARHFHKFGWTYDNDCRLTKSPQGIGITIAPTLPLVLPPHALANGGSHHYHPKANPGSFRRSYLGKALRWFTRNKRRVP
jgi:hypothetical protein